MISDELPLIVRTASMEDIPSVMQINKKWMASNIGSDKSNGFLSGEPLSAHDLTKIITERELVVAEHDLKVIGYYLFDNYSETALLSQYKVYISELIRKGHLPADLRISNRAQAAIDKEYQNKVLSKLLLELLLKETFGKYDLLFSAVSKANPKLVAHEKTGWKIISEDQNWIFVQYPLR